ncbi:hypothetical protein B4090_2355 [Bacillus licheniformis]|nr:hypothetical protein B4090_2355 [Bacillus licheniformis]
MGQRNRFRKRTKAVRFKTKGLAAGHGDLVHDPAQAMKKAVNEAYIKLNRKG